MFCTLIRLLSWPLNLESSLTDLSVETALFGLETDASSSEVTVYEKNISDESTKHYILRHLLSNESFKEQNATLSHKQTHQLHYTRHANHKRLVSLQLP